MCRRYRGGGGLRCVVVRTDRHRRRRTAVARGHAGGVGTARACAGTQRLRHRCRRPRSNVVVDRRRDGSERVSVIGRHLTRLECVTQRRRERKRSEREQRPARRDDVRSCRSGQRVGRRRSTDRGSEFVLTQRQRGFTRVEPATQRADVGQPGADLTRSGDGSVEPVESTHPIFHRHRCHVVMVPDQYDESKHVFDQRGNDRYRQLTKCLTSIRATTRSAGPTVEPTVGYSARNVGRETRQNGHPPPSRRGGTGPLESGAAVPSPSVPEVVSERVGRARRPHPLPPTSTPTRRQQTLSVAN